VDQFERSHVGSDKMATFIVEEETNCHSNSSDRKLS
jgi:hypothetical protein